MEGCEDEIQGKLTKQKKTKECTNARREKGNQKIQTGVKRIQLPSLVLDNKYWLVL